MKLLTYTLMLIAGVAAGFLSVNAQAPHGFNYQAVARDASGEVISNQQVTLQVGLLHGSAEGELLYREAFTPVTDDFGLVQIVIGTGSVLEGDFEAINWGQGPYFMEIAIDVEGGSDFVAMGTTKLLSVPYALHARTSADAFSGDYHDLDHLPDLDGMVAFEDPEPGDMLYFAGNEWQPIPIGEEDHVLRIVEGIPQWVAFESDVNGDVVVDIDGNAYPVVEIDGVNWMAENLRVTRYNNGDDIPHVTSGDDWSGLDTGAYAVYNNDDDNSPVFGILYNWYAVDDDRGICPEGWRVPADEEYEDLLYYVDPGGTINDNIAGGRLKHTGTTDDGEGGLWSPPNTGASDDHDFAALPAGARFSGGVFGGLHDLAYFWSATPTPSEQLQRAWIWYMSYTSDIFYRNNYSRVQGHSVRCIQDQSE